MGALGLLGLLVLFGQLATAGGALFTNGLAPLQGVTPPPALGLSAQECGLCHGRTYAQWAASRHARAWTNAVFRASYRLSPERWCVYCHAPLPEQASLIADAPWPIVPAPLVAEGVNCAACHVRGGRILTPRPPSAAASAAHPMQHEPSLASAGFCGGCHQFNWPHDAPPLRYTAEPMQDTLAEWQRSAPGRAGTSCQQCHMPSGNHMFPGGHDRALMQKTVSAEVARSGRDEVRITLHASGAGHSVPTGDPFRRLCVELCTEPGCARPLRRVLFFRRFGRTAGRLALELDRTVPPPQQGPRADVVSRQTEVPEAARYFRVLYQFAAPGTEPLLRGEDLQIELVRGVIMPESGAPPRAPAPS